MKEQEEAGSFFITITADVLYDKDLSPIDKLLYAEISSLANKKGYCFASNSHFGKMFDRNNTTISTILSKLCKKNYIAIEIDQEAGNKRKIFLSQALKNQNSSSNKSQEGYSEKSKDPYFEKSQHSNTSSSYTSFSNSDRGHDEKTNFKKQTDNLKSFQEIERFFQNKCNDSIDENLEMINNDFSKDEITLLAEFAINRIKGKNNIKNTKTALKSSIYNRAVKIKASLAGSGVDFKEIFRKDEDVYIYLMKDGGSRVIDSLDQWIVDRVLKDKQIKKNNSTAKDSNLDSRLENLYMANNHFNTI